MLEAHVFIVSVVLVADDINSSTPVEHRDTGGDQQYVTATHGPGGSST